MLTLTLVAVLLYGMKTSGHEVVCMTSCKYMYCVSIDVHFKPFYSTYICLVTICMYPWHANEHIMPNMERCKCAIKTGLCQKHRALVYRWLCKQDRAYKDKQDRAYEDYDVSHPCNPFGAQCCFAVVTWHNLKKDAMHMYKEDVGKGSFYLLSWQPFAG